MRDGKESFYRRLKLDKETRQVISFFRKIRQKMLAENEERGKK